MGFPGQAVGPAPRARGAEAQPLARLPSPPPTPVVSVLRGALSER